MGTWPHHIDRFERQYNKYFAKDPLFGADLMDIIHKRVQVFLHSRNTSSIKDVELGSLAEFGGLKKKVDRGEWLKLTPGWVDRPTPKEEGRRKSDGHENRSRLISGVGGRGTVHNIGIDLQLRIMEKLG